jgi:HEPN domain-containing protein
LQQAKNSLKKGDFLATILLSTTSLEFYLRRLLEVSTPTPWSTLVTHLRDRLAQQEISSDEVQAILNKLKEIRNVRNKAAHPSPDTSFNIKEAQDIVDDVESLLRKILQYVRG